MTKVLLDTNIIIHRESGNVVRDDIGQLFHWMDKLGYKKYIHPLTEQELGKHQDKKVAGSMKIKLESYLKLKTLAPIEEAIKKIMLAHDKSQNDKNDSRLLNEVFADRVDYLITEDKDAHTKAEKLRISDKVLRIEDFLHKAVTENPDLSDYRVLSVRRVFFGSLDINDPFFDSFKSDYKGFDKWFNRKSDEPVYVCESDSKIMAFLYLKTEGEDERYSDINPAFNPKKRLKIGTFKVSNTGHKLGERFIKIIFDNALEQKVDEIYVTIFDKQSKQKYLIKLLEDWGFKYHGTKDSSSGEEQVYVRDFSKKFDINNIRHTYPFICGRKRKFIVPIRPEYHTDLLPDSILTNEKPENFLENKSHRNAIHKVYISRSIRRDMKKGDIILFYRTGGRYISVITTIGIVDSVIDGISDKDKFVGLCKARSVFSDNELRARWNDNTRPFIVNFLYIARFPTPFLNLDKLVDLRIISSLADAPRGFEKISEDNFNLLMEKANANTDIIVY